VLSQIDRNRWRHFTRWLCDGTPEVYAFCDDFAIEAAVVALSATREPRRGVKLVGKCPHRLSLRAINATQASKRAAERYELTIGIDGTGSGIVDGFPYVGFSCDALRCLLFFIERDGVPNAYFARRYIDFVRRLET